MQFVDSIKKKCGKRVGRISWLSVCAFLFLFNAPAYSQSYKEFVATATKMLEEGNYDGAITHYKKALDKDSLNSMNEFIYANLALAYMNKGESRRVEEVYREALSRNPQSQMLLMRRANFYLVQDKQEKALADYNKVLSYDPRNEEALYFRAYILAGKKKYNLAREDYYTILAINPDNYKAQFALALLYVKEKKDNQALLMLDNLIEKDSGNPEYYQACSDIEKGNKRYELALIYIDEGIKKCKNNNTLRLEKAELLVAMNKNKEAKRELDALSSTGYYSPRMKLLYKRIK